jgi:hypothetical protein
MSYLPHERRDRMRELLREVDSNIMMCDDVQDLMALASMMLISSKNIFKVHVGVEGTKDILYKVLEDLYDEQQ